MVNENIETIFPWSFVEEMIVKLKSKQVNFIRYADFDIHKYRKFPYPLNYLFEYTDYKYHTSNLFDTAVLALCAALYKKQLVKNNLLIKYIFGKQKKIGPTIVLQHDADILPQKTIQIMELENKHGITSSNFFFLYIQQKF